MMGRASSSRLLLLLLLAAGAMASAMGIVASTHHVREGYARLQVLEDVQGTSSIGRDAAEVWVSVLQLRGQLRVACGQAVY